MKSVALLTAIVVAAGGFATVAEARLAPSGLARPAVSGAPATVTPGQTVSLRGTIRGTERLSRTVTLTATLRRGTGPKVSRVVGSRSVRTSSGRRAKAFALTFTVPTRDFAGTSAATAYRLVVCAQVSRGRRATCRAVRTLVVKPRPASPPAQAAPAPAPPASPAPPADGTPATTTPPGATPERTFTPGAPTVGDVLLPLLGNGGYDAQHYGLDLAYTPGTHQLGGTTTMTARATQDLSRFSMDLQGFTVTKVTVDGTQAAAVTRAPTKLVVTPVAGIPSGSTFVVAVTYAGQPPVITDEDGSDEGFLQTPDGAFVVAEPSGAQGWFPSNNHPSDKATLTLKMTVPSNLEVIGNGTLAARAASSGGQSFTWVEDHPMATYLATATLGLFNITTGTARPGLPLYDAVDPAAAAAVAVQGNVAREGQAITFLESYLGPYPFSITGSIVDNAPTTGYALETQTKPNYPLPPDVITISHELAHQWFGDSVSLKQWQDIWLNEGFATWAEWYFGEQRDNGDTTVEHFDDLYAKAADDDFWKLPPAKPPTAGDLFAAPVYQRGAMTLEALREKVGTTTFLSILKTWVTEHAYGNATTPEFIATAQRVSARDLGAFFQDWLYDADKPARP